MRQKRFFKEYQEILKTKGGDNMPKEARRYWFKFYNSFFENEKIKEIKRRKDGDRIILIFINCLCIAANCESGGYLKISENKFFTIQTLAHHMGRNQESIRCALDIFLEYSMIIQDEYGYKIKNWNKYQSLQEKGIKGVKQSTNSSKNVETEKEKQIKEEIKIETGGEDYTGKIQDYL